MTILGNRKMKMKELNILILNIAFADLGISVTGYPMVTASNYAKRYDQNVYYVY